MCNSSFYLNTRGHCRVIDWPNFNIVVPWGIERPEEKERDGGMASWWSSQNTQHLYINFMSYMGMVCGTPKQFQE